MKLGGCYVTAPSIILYDIWREISEYCNREDFDSKVFKKLIDNFNSQYRKINYSEQGEFHYMVYMGVV